MGEPSRPPRPRLHGLPSGPNHACRRRAGRRASSIRNAGERTVIRFQPVRSELLSAYSKEKCESRSRRYQSRPSQGNTPAAAAAVQARQLGHPRPGKSTGDGTLRIGQLADQSIACRSLTERRSAAASVVARSTSDAAFVSISA